MNSNDEFLAAMAMLKPLPIPTIEYRIYYNEQGTITMCAMTNHPLDENYIVVSKEEYNNYFRYTVVEGKLKKIDTNPGYRVQLKKSTTGYPVVKNHAGLIVEASETYEDTEHYDTNN
jgi:hypothetical protein